MASNQKVRKQGRGIKEAIRKFFVSLKRNPQNITMVVMLVAFVIYTLNLGAVSKTTSVVNGANMGQCEFATTLFSILAFVCFLRSFPRRQKPKFLMLGLMVLMECGLAFFDVIYVIRINQAITRTEAPIVISDATKYISTAQSIVTLHIILVLASVALILLLPIYSKAIKAINTSIEVEGNENMAAIDISGED